MNVKISVFVIYVEAIIYLLLNNLHDCTFKSCPDVRKDKSVENYMFDFFLNVTF